MPSYRREVGTNREGVAGGGQLSHPLGSTVAFTVLPVMAWKILPDPGFFLGVGTTWH